MTTEARKKTYRDSQKARRDRLRAEGLKLAQVWIPDNDAAMDSINRSAARLRKNAGIDIV